MPSWILSALTKNKAIDTPVPVPSVWTDHLAYLCSYFHGQTASLIKQMVRFWSSVLTTVYNVNTECFTFTVCNVSTCAPLVPSYSCLGSIWEGNFLKAVYVLGMLRPWSTGAACVWMFSVGTWLSWWSFPTLMILWVDESRALSIQLALVSFLWYHLHGKVMQSSINSFVNANKTSPNATLMFSTSSFTANPLNSKIQCSQLLS